MVEHDELGEVPSLERCAPDAVAADRLWGRALLSAGGGLRRRDPLVPDLDEWPLRSSTRERPSSRAGSISSTRWDWSEGEAMSADDIRPVRGGDRSMQLTPSDLIEATEAACEAVQAGLERDWTVSAGGLDWGVRQTLEHAAGAMVWYAAHLASGCNSFAGLQVRAREQVDNEAVLNMLPTAAKLLGTVAAAVPEDARGHHLAGMADRTGFLALGCEEVLVHAGDAARGLGLPYEPPAQIASKVLRRLFPWAPTGTDPHETLLWATGRGSLPGYDDLDEHWGMHPAPLSEWDGTMPRGMFVALAFEWQEDERRWAPRSSSDS